jgi:hypothetical protein
MGNEFNNHFDFNIISIRIILFLMFLPAFSFSAEYSDSTKIRPSIGVSLNYPKGFDLDIGIKQVVTKWQTFEYDEKILSFNADYNSFGLNFGYGRYKSEILPAGGLYSLSYMRLYNGFFSKNGSNLVGVKVRMKIALDLCLSAHYNVNKNNALWSIGVGFWNWK